ALCDAAARRAARFRARFRRRQAAAFAPVGTRVPDPVQAGRRACRFRDRDRALYLGKDREHLSLPHPREDEFLDECGPHDLRTTQWPDRRVTCRTRPIVTSIEFWHSPLTPRFGR